MPRFEKLAPKNVAVGRSRAAVPAREPYIKTLKAGAAGRVELKRGETQAVVKRRFREGARESGVRIRSSWERPHSLVWKRTGQG